MNLLPGDKPDQGADHQERGISQARHGSWASVLGSGMSSWLGTSSLGFACQLRGANYKQAILQDMDDAVAGLRSMEKEMDACITSNDASQDGSKFMMAYVLKPSVVPWRLQSSKT